MEFLCKVCDRSIIENESEYKKHLATSGKKNDKCLYTKYTINNVNLNEFNKILSEYISHHNKNVDLYVYKITFELNFNNNFVQCKETNLCLNKDNKNMKSFF